MKKENLHIFRIFKMLFMLVFTAELHAIKLLVDAYMIDPSFVFFYDIKAFSESIIYSVLILIGGFLLVSKIV